MTPAEREAARAEVARLSIANVQSPFVHAYHWCEIMADYLVERSALWSAREASIDVDGAQPELRQLALVQAATATAKVELLDDLLVQVLEIARGLSA